MSYLATYRSWPGAPGDAAVDGEMARRIEAHRRRRPAGWVTREVGADLPVVLGEITGTVLIDSLGTWIAGHQDFVADVEALCDSLRTRAGDALVVSDEVGLGVHPETGVGRRFRDSLGSANRAVADVADRCVLVVAGRVLELGPPESLWP